MDGLITKRQKASATHILVVNAGSSSIKLAIVPSDAKGPGWRAAVEGIGAAASASLLNDQGETLFSGNVKPAHGAAHEAALAFLMNTVKARFPLENIIAAGHRVVHGGTLFRGPAAASALVIRKIQSLVNLAPLHQPHNLAGLRAAKKLLPDVPHIACFDTAFHQTIPESRHAYALPADLRRAGVRRFGFHGLSYEHIASLLPGHLPVAKRRRVIVAHLGNGCSLCALKDGVSFDTTMGITPLDGLMMGTRSGSVDPSVLLHLIRRMGRDPEWVEDMLNRKSGLLGVSGETSDMRALLASGSASARLAIDLFVLSAARGIAAMAASLEGVDAVIFTGGIGERAAAIRARIAGRLGWLGLRLDEAANLSDQTRISAPGSKIAALVLPADEARVIARQTLETAAASLLPPSPHGNGEKALSEA